MDLEKIQKLVGEVSREQLRHADCYLSGRMCFQNGRGVQLRVAGEVELVEDIALKEEIVAHPSREFLRPWIAENGLEPLAVFRLRGGRATVWTMATNFEPNRYLEL